MLKQFLTEIFFFKTQRKMNWNKGACFQSTCALIYFYIEEVMESVPESGFLTGCNRQ